MTDLLEDLIRHAQERRAADAADPVRLRRIQQALPKLAARRTRRIRLGGLAAAVALAATVAVPLTVLPNGKHAERYGAAQSSIAQQAPTEAGDPLALRYSPTWLPDGLVEQSWISRLAKGTGPDVERAFSELIPANFDKENVRDDERPTFRGIRLKLRNSSVANEPAANGRAGIDIGSHKGFYNGSNAVEWRIDDHTIGSVEASSGLSKEDIVRFAGSLQPDTRTRVSGLEPVYQALPAGQPVVVVQVIGRSPTEANLIVSAASLVIMVTRNDSTKLPNGGEARTIAGHPARVLTTSVKGWNLSNNSKAIVVDLGGGRTLSVTSSGREGDPQPSVDDLQKVAVASVGLNADLAWVGTR